MEHQVAVTMFKQKVAQIKVSIPIVFNVFRIELGSYGAVMQK